MAESTAHFKGFPNEIIIRILHCCESRTILRFATTCKRNFNIVNNTVSLQLHIELEANGFEIIKKSSSGNPTYSTIIEELRRYRDAWLDLDLGPSIDEHVEDSVMTEWVICGSTHTCAFSTSDDPNHLDSLQMMPLNSPDPPPPPVRFHCNFQHFTVDLSQELAVLIERHPQNSTWARIHLCSTTTGLSHPLAKHPQLTAEIHFDSSFRPSITDFQVMGNLLLTKFTAISSYRYEVLVWDWVRSVLLHRIDCSTGVCDAAFLDREHLVLGSATCSEPPKPLHSISLLIFDMYALPSNHQPQSNGHFEVSSCPTSEPILKLDFPRLLGSVLLSPIEFRLSSAPTPGGAMHISSVTFVSSHTLTLAMRFTLVQLGLTPGDSQALPRESSYCVFISGDHLLNRLKQRKLEGWTTTMILPWDDWGENATRWFRGKHELSQWASRISGSRFVHSFGHRRRSGETISVLDFNTPTVRRHSARSTNLCTSPSWSMDERKAYKKEILKRGGFYWPRDSSFNGKSHPDTSNIPPGIISLAETVESRTETTMRVGFEQPVVSRLPYRIVRMVRLLPDYYEWRIDGEHLVGIQAASGWSELCLAYKVQASPRS